MAVDPLVLARQRRAVVTGGESRCECGARTRSITGKCKACLVDFTGIAALPTHKLVALMGRVKAELAKRRAEIDAALTEAA